MSEEEREVLKTFKKGLGLTSAEQEILVNYIDKLQKENEELKFFAESYRKQIELMQNEYKAGNFIHKGFIKDKIKEMQTEKINGFHKTYIAEEVLKELLGE